MIEQAAESAIASLISVDGVNIYTSREDGDRVLPCFVVECEKAEPLSSSQIYRLSLSIQLRSHAEDDARDAHDARFESAVQTLAQTDWRNVNTGGIEFMGAFLGEREHRREEFHWLSELKLRAGVKFISQ